MFDSRSYMLKTSFRLTIIYNAIKKEFMFLVFIKNPENDLFLNNLKMVTIISIEGF